jgi:hypothetical protein
VIGAAFGLQGILIALLLGFLLGVLFAIPVNFVFLPLVCLLPEDPAKPLCLYAVGFFGGLVSLTLVALCERLFVEADPQHSTGLDTSLVVGLVGGIAGTACAALFHWVVRRQEQQCQVRAGGE